MPGAFLEVEPADPVLALILARSGQPPHVALPIVTLEPGPLGRGSRAATGHQGAWVPGVAWPLPARVAKRKPSPPDEPEPEPDGPERVRRFRRVATEIARKLARLLAAAPVLTLPVLRLVREAMLPDAWQGPRGRGPPGRAAEGRGPDGGGRP